MKQRARPPEDISPQEFFTRWVPEQVASDPDRRDRLASTTAILQFDLSGEGGGSYALQIDRGEVRPVSATEAPDLRVRVDVETWRLLNRGELSAPEAALRRRVKLEGNLILAIKLHLILG